MLSGVIYGFVERVQYRPEVVSTETLLVLILGWRCLSIENHRSGLVWTLMDSFYATASAHRAAGFHLTLEPEPRPVHRTDVNPPIR